jgi:hypothetical protein
VAPALDQLPPAMIRTAPLAALLLLAACGVESDSSLTAEPTARGTSPLEGSFEAAAREYQVPVGLLKSVAWVETRISPTGTQPSITGGRGVMSLVKREDWDMLGKAAQLTGLDAKRLEIDERANIRGAAAVLRNLADKSLT